MTIHINGEPHPLQAQTVADLLQQMGLTQQRVAIEINGDVVPRSQHATQMIRDGDRIEIVRAIGGG
jgi:sulfur carrier protein